MHQNIGSNLLQLFPTVDYNLAFHQLSQINITQYNQPHNYYHSEYSKIFKSQHQSTTINNNHFSSHQLIWYLTLQVISWPASTSSVTCFSCTALAWFLIGQYSIGWTFWNVYLSKLAARKKRVDFSPTRWFTIQSSTEFLLRRRSEKVHVALPHSCCLQSIASELDGSNFHQIPTFGGLMPRHLSCFHPPFESQGKSQILTFSGTKGHTFYVMCSWPIKRPLQGHGLDFWFDPFLLHVSINSHHHWLYLFHLILG